MSGFTGTGRLFRLAVRRDRIVGTAWVLGLFAFAYSQAASIVSLYPTQADLDRLARTAGGIGASFPFTACQRISLSSKSSIRSYSLKSIFRDRSAP